MRSVGRRDVSHEDEGDIMMHRCLFLDKAAHAAGCRVIRARVSVKESGKERGSESKGQMTERADK